MTKTEATNSKGKRKPLGLVFPPKPHAEETPIPPPITLSQSITYTSILIPGCIAIGISPTDCQLKKVHTFINVDIKKILKRNNVTRYHFVGEWSPEKHRWHYHGIILFKDMTQLDKVRRSLQRNVGRTDIEQLKDAEAYIDYMHKIYKEALILNTVQPFQPDSYILSPYTQQIIEHLTGLGIPPL